jgi:nucleoid-associated protein YgaU
MQKEAQQMPRYLTAPSRALVIISTFVVALVLLLASSVMAAGPELETVDYRVRSGDTLWTIAEEVSPDEDVRGVVSEIRHLNDLDTSLIIPGETLVVPTG